MIILFLITFILEDLLPPGENSMMHSVVSIIEWSCAIFFTTEYILRFLCCPAKIRFLKNAMNVVDLLAIIPFFVDLLLDQVDDIDILGKAGKAIRLSRVLRVIRIFKLVRHFAGLQSLMYTVYEAYQELGLMLLVVLIVEMIFTVLIYFAEKETPKTTKSIFKCDEEDKWSFVECLWFCLMTLTTVGDNRKYPSSSFGQLIGGVCAVMGTCIISLPIPIVVNSFARCYKNELWRNEVTQRRRELINKVTQQKMKTIGDLRMAKDTLNIIRTSSSFRKKYCSKPVDM